MYKQLLIITTQNINEKLLKDIDYLIINNDKLVTFNNYYQINYNDQIIDFDYLIIDKPINNVLIENINNNNNINIIIVTNQYLESSIDNYFIIGCYNASPKSLDEQIETIIDYINGNI